MDNTKCVDSVDNVNNVDNATFHNANSTPNAVRSSPRRRRGEEGGVGRAVGVAEGGVVHAVDFVHAVDIVHALSLIHI